jgi:hypothetical protein
MPEELQASVGRVWPLFDHSVREREQRWRDGQVEVLRGLKIERKIEPGRTFHGQIRRLLAVEDIPGIHPTLRNASPMSEP